MRGLRTGPSFSTWLFLAMGCAPAPPAPTPSAPSADGTGIVVLAAPSIAPERFAAPTGSATVSASAPPRALSCNEAIRGWPGEQTRGQTAPILNRGMYLTACGVPLATRVEICAATRDSRIVGIDVQTKPVDPALDACIASAIRSMGFPSMPILDVSHVVFEAH